jgi:hypothetical protein
VYMQLLAGLTSRCAAVVLLPASIHLRVVSELTAAVLCGPGLTAVALFMSCS